MIFSYCLTTYFVHCNNVYFFKGVAHYELPNDDQEVAQVGGLHPAVTYKFRVFAINFIDSSEPTGPVVAKTQEEGIISKINV